MHDNDDDRPRLGRRQLIAGAGLLAGAAAAAATSATSAAAAPESAGAAGLAPSPATPITTTIASARLPGLTYRTAFMFDFSPESPSANRAWGGQGAYSQGSETTMWASLEIPAGATIRDIEWYVRNNSGATRTTSTRIWQAGIGTLGDSVGDTSIPSGAATIGAFRTVTSSTVWGPFPSGTKLALGLRTPTNATVQINGVRVGFGQGSGALAPLMSPEKGYDTRGGDGRFSNNETRTITLNATSAPRGVTGAFLNLSTLDGAPKGRIKIWPTGFAEPGQVTMYYDDKPTNAYVYVPVPPDGRLNVKATRGCHVSINVVSWVG